MDNDTLGRIVDGDTLIYERTVPHPPSRVWRAISDEAELRAWMRYPVAFEAQAGAQVDFFSGDIIGRVFIADPPRTLAFSFWDADKPEYAPRVDEDWTVRWDLEPVDGGTRITFTHRRLDGRAMWGVGDGWHSFLAQLIAYLDGGVDQLVSFQDHEAADYKGLIGEYRVHISRALLTWSDEAATTARAALAAGDTATAITSIDRLHLAARQLYDIARQVGERPDFTQDV